MFLTRVFSKRIHNFRIKKILDNAHCYIVLPPSLWEPLAVSSCQFKVNDCPRVLKLELNNQRVLLGLKMHPLSPSSLTTLKSSVVFG